jgi:hypothetical protein
MSYHAECWQENFGCSSYGCPKVDVLKPHEEVPVPVESTETVAAEEMVPQHRWDIVLLAASVVGSVIATVTFGITAAIVAVLGVVVFLKGTHRPVLLIIAIVISSVGIVAGLGVSDFWYFNGRHLPNVFMHH